MSDMCIRESSVSHFLSSRRCNCRVSTSSFSAFIRSSSVFRLENDAVGRRHHERIVLFIIHLNLKAQIVSPGSLRGPWKIIWQFVDNATKLHLWRRQSCFAESCCVFGLCETGSKWSTWQTLKANRPTELSSQCWNKTQTTIKLKLDGYIDFLRARLTGHFKVQRSGTKVPSVFPGGLSGVTVGALASKMKMNHLVIQKWQIIYYLPIKKTARKQLKHLIVLCIFCFQRLSGRKIFSNIIFYV